MGYSSSADQIYFYEENMILRDHFLKILLPQIIIGVIALAHLFMYQQWHWLMATFIFLLLSYVIGEGIFLHRYFSHKAFECPAWLAKTFAFLAMLGGFGTPIAYRMVHLSHHAHSDTEQDPHTPQRGFWHAVNGWYFSPMKVSLASCKSLLADPYYVWLGQNQVKTWWAVTLIIGIVDWKLVLYTIGLGGLLGYIFLNFCTNYLAHTHGTQRFTNNDNSRNIWWLSWILLQGSGALQNNHHAIPGRYHDSHTWYELDLGRWIIPIIATKINHR